MSQWPELADEFQSLGGWVQRALRCRRMASVFPQEVYQRKGDDLH